MFSRTARAVGATIHLLELVVPVLQQAWTQYEGIMYFDPAWDEQALARAKRYINGLLGHLRTAGLDARGEAEFAPDTPGSYGWGLTVLSIGLGVVTVNIGYRPQPFLMYPLSIGASLLGLALLGGVLVGVVGVLISLNAPTVRQPYQRLSLVMILASLPVLSLQTLPQDWRAVVLPRQDNWALFALAAGSVLLLVDLWLLAMCLDRFRRPRLMSR